MNATEDADIWMESDSNEDVHVETSKSVFVTITCSFSLTLSLICCLYCGRKYIQNTRQKIEIEAVSNCDIDKNVNSNVKSDHLEISKPATNEQPKHTMQHSSLPSLKPERKAKGMSSFMIIISVLILVFVSIWDGQNPYHMFAYLSMILVGNWIIWFSTVVLSSEHLHMIYVKRKKLKHSNFLFVPYGCVEDEHCLITSVSSINALGGSNAERYSLLKMYGTFALAYCAVCAKWSEIHSETVESFEFTRMDLELLLFAVSNTCMLMIGTWELEASTFAQVSHYAAAGICCICTPTAFMLQQDFSAFSVAYCSVGLFGLVEWFILMKKLPERHEDLSVVHKLSKISIMNEMIVLMMLYSTGVMFAYNL